MLRDNIIHRSLVQSLSVLGTQNVYLLIRTLEEQGAIRNDTIDLKRVEKSLEEIFGEGSKILYAGIALSA